MKAVLCALLFAAALVALAESRPQNDDAVAFPEDDNAEDSGTEDRQGFGGGFRPRQQQRPRPQGTRQTGQNFGRPGQQNFGRPGQQNFGRPGQQNFGRPNQNVGQQNQNFPQQNGNNPGFGEPIEDSDLTNQNSGRPGNNNRPPATQTQPPSSTDNSGTTTRVPPRDPGNRIVYNLPAGCNCPFTPQYSPVCGTDGQTYGNMNILRCTQQCGTTVDLYLAGACGRNNG